MPTRPSQESNLGLQQTRLVLYQLSYQDQARSPTRTSDILTILLLPSCSIWPPQTSALFWPFPLPFGTIANGLPPKLYYICTLNIVLRINYWYLQSQSDIYRVSLLGLECLAFWQHYYPCTCDLSWSKIAQINGCMCVCLRCKMQEVLCVRVQKLQLKIIVSCQQMIAREERW